MAFGMTSLLMFIENQSWQIALFSTFCWVWGVILLAHCYPRINRLQALGLDNE